MPVISYAPLWKTMDAKGATTYTLQVKGGVSSSTIRRMKKGDSVSTNTLDAICKILNCNLDEVAVFVDERKEGKT